MVNSLLSSQHGAPNLHTFPTRSAKRDAGHRAEGPLGHYHEGTYPWNRAGGRRRVNVRDTYQHLDAQLDAYFSTTNNNLYVYVLMS